ncbi:uncharacterized protein [Montipora foliosa]|uniref:uncharacterized protein n=1 Tax=Montipora foliosa TaxID=591990 RepID=UPI0035F114EA
MKAKERFSIAMGTVFNDLFRQLNISFTISFLMKVVEVTPSHAGICMLIGQCVDGLSSLLAGYLGDHVKIPFLSRKIGQRKSWHFIGSVLMSIGVPLTYNRCLFCNKSGDPTWLPLVYYAFAFLITNVAYGTMQINHLAVITIVPETIKEATAVSALGTLFSFGAGIYIYFITWGLLGQQGGNDLGPSNLKQFQYLAWIAVGTGIFTSVVFYIGTKEKKVISPLARKISTFIDPKNAVGVFQSSQILYSSAFKNDDGNKRETATLAETFLEMLVSSVRKEESWDHVTDEGVTEMHDRSIRKLSWVDRFLQAVFSEDSNGRGKDNDSDEGGQLGEVTEKDGSDNPSDLITKVKKLDQERKKSLAMRFIDGLVQTIWHHENQSAETKTVTTTGHEDQFMENEEVKNNKITSLQEYVNKNCEEDDNCTPTRKKDEGATKDSRMVRQRRCGVVFSAEDVQNKGKVNLGYQNEYVEPEIRVEPSCDTISLNDSFTDEVLNDTIPRTKKVSFFEGPLGLTEQDVEKDLTFVKNNEDHSVKYAGEHMNVSSWAKKAQREKISTLEERNEPLRNDAEKEFIGVVTCDPSPSGKHFRTKSKTAKDWMVDPHLYKVAIIVTCTRLVQDAVFGYLPLYLTETLGFEVVRTSGLNLAPNCILLMFLSFFFSFFFFCILYYFVTLLCQAIAYFPLVLFGSAALASIVSDKLNNRIGSKWTYILTSCFVMGGSVYCFFQSPSKRQFMYAPVTLIGIGMSITYVMTMAYTADLVKESTESSGFALSVMTIIARISSGAFFMTIQEFYPENHRKTSTSNYVRYVFSVVPGILALTGCVLVLLFQPSMICCNKQGSLNEVVIQSEKTDTRL